MPCESCQPGGGIVRKFAASPPSGGLDPASAINETGIEGELLSRLNVFNRVAVLQIFLITALDPFGKTLDVQAVPGFTQFIDEDMVRQAVFEHDVDHVASLFWEASDGRWMMDGG